MGATTFMLLGFMLTFGFAATFLLVRDLWKQDSQRMRRRMTEEFSAGAEAPTASPLFKNRPQTTSAPAQAKRPLFAGNLSLGTCLQEYLDQADLPWRAAVFGAMVAGAGLLAALALGWWRGPLMAAVGLLAGWGGPSLFLYARIQARREKFLKQLPTAFDLMARVMRSGNSVAQALQAVAESCDNPIAGEFSRCEKQVHLGLAPELAFQEMAQRTGVLETRIFVMAMLIQRQTGGNLVEVLERLAAMVRLRLRLRNQVRTHTAEGRMQGWTLMVLPFFLFGVMMVVNRPYVEVLFGHGHLIAAAIGSMIVGMLWIRRIVNFDY